MLESLLEEILDRLPIFTALVTRIDALENDVADSKDEIARLEDLITSTQETADAALDRVEAAVDRLELDVSSVQSTADQCEAEISDLRHVINSVAGSAGVQN